MKSYLLGIDQSTQGTKVLLFDESGQRRARADRPHRQYVDDRGWVEHDPDEIWANLRDAIQDILKFSGVSAAAIRGIGISNQRETVMAWHRQTGEAPHRAIVWQCARGQEICTRIADRAEDIRERSGLPLSPYFSAAKWAWLMTHVPVLAAWADQGNLCLGTMDSWLLFRLTGGRSFYTEPSNASRTQLFNIRDLTWDDTLCDYFGVPRQALPEVLDSDSAFGTTDLDGLLPQPVPIAGMLGDSQSALFAQGCHQPGMVKATYGTVSSVGMQLGAQPQFSRRIVTSVGWRQQGVVSYILEGNINYAGAVVTWLKDELGLLSSIAEVEGLIAKAHPEDTTYLVPAFSGLGAPYWQSHACASVLGMTRLTGRAELVKAAVDSIAYQITDIVETMRTESGFSPTALLADGGATANRYLMQFQSDLLDIPVLVAPIEELSGMGAAYLAGLTLGIYHLEQLFAPVKRQRYDPRMSDAVRQQKYAGWMTALRACMAFDPPWNRPLKDKILK